MRRIGWLGLSAAAVALAACGPGPGGADARVLDDAWAGDGGDPGLCDTWIGAVGDDAPCPGAEGLACCTSRVGGRGGIPGDGWACRSGRWGFVADQCRCGAEQDGTPTAGGVCTGDAGI